MTLSNDFILFHYVSDEKAILIYGPEQVLCGETAQFDAEVEQREISNWSVTWHKKAGDITTNINTRDEKFNGSTDRRLFIHSVCKDDEAEYQAVISNGDNSYMSNVIYLRAIGGIILFMYTGQITS